jgi:predicted dehydrogenase
MDRVRVGIIGCRGIATGKHMPSLQALGNVDMVAFMDANEARALAAKERFGAPDSRVYTDYRRLLEQKDIDAVISARPIKVTARSASRPIRLASTSCMKSP